MPHCCRPCVTVDMCRCIAVGSERASAPWACATGSRAFVHVCVCGQLRCARARALASCCGARAPTFVAVITSGGHAHRRLVGARSNALCFRARAAAARPPRRCMPPRDVQSRQRLVTAHTRALLLLAHNTISRAVVLAAATVRKNFPAYCVPCSCTQPTALDFLGHDKRHVIRCWHVTLRVLWAANMGLCPRRAPCARRGARRALVPWFLLCVCLLLLVLAIFMRPSLYTVAARALFCGVQQSPATPGTSAARPVAAARSM